MTSPQPVSNMKNALAIGLTSLGALTGVAALIISSTLLVQNRVSPNANYAADSLQTVGYNEVARDSACSSTTLCTRTATGGVAGYDTLLLVPPNNSTIAATRGLHTATGALKFLQLDIIRNPANVKIDCSVVGATKTGTGGTKIFSDISGTGTTVVFSPISYTATTLGVSTGTGITVTVGPTQYIKCGTLGTPTSAFKAVLKGEFSESEVVN